MAGQPAALGLASLGLALLVFAIILLLFGKDPLRAYVDIFRSHAGQQLRLQRSAGQGDSAGARAPAAVMLPARIGLVNVGGEGQIYMGAWLATWRALVIGDMASLPIFVALPLVLLPALSAAACGR